MMGFESIDIIEFCINASFGICVFILFKNAGFHSLKFFNSFLTIQIKATSSFMAAGGIFLYMQWVTQAPVLGAFEHVANLDAVDRMCRDVVGTMCKKPSYNLTLSTAWFEDITRSFYINNYRCIVYFWCVLMFANCDLFAKSLFSGIVCYTLKRRGIAHLLPIATSVMLPDDDEKVRRQAIVQLMIRRLQNLQINIVYFMMVEIGYLSVALFGLIVSPVRVILSDNLPIRINGSAWSMVCDRQITSQDVYAMVRCRSDSNGDKIDSYCIVPNNRSLFHLETATWFFLLLLAVACVVSLVNKLYGIWKFGLGRMTDINLVKFLKQNVNYPRHRLIIDLFAMKLEERRRKMEEEENGYSCKTGEKETALPIAKDMEQGVVTNNKDALVVRVDVGICNPD